MGFSIGRFIGSIAPGIGAILGGPVGAILGAGVAGALNEPARPIGRVTTPAAPQPPVSPTSVGPTVQPQAFRFPSVQTASFSPLVRGAAQIATGFGLSEFFNGGNGCPPRTELQLILAQARANVRGATKRKIIAAAKACGIDIAAGTFGLDPRQICLVIVTGAGRRRRGISAADVRRTRRTIRFVNSLRKDLKKLKA